jgi:hypothetical protein
VAELSHTQIRAAAAECASRVVEPGSPTGHLLSSARMIETYIRSGLSQVGPRFKQGLVCGAEDAVVRVEGNLSEEQAAQIQQAVTNLLTNGPTA